MKASSTHTGQAAGHASGVAVRALAVPEPRTLEDLDDGDIRALATFLLVPQSPWPYFAFLAVVTLLRILIDHPLLTWMNIMVMALPGYLLTGWRLQHRRYNAFLRDELRLDPRNARAMHIFAMREAKASFGLTAEAQLAHTRALIGRAQARRDGTG